MVLENELFEPRQLKNLYIITREEGKPHGARLWSEYEGIFFYVRQHLTYAVLSEPKFTCKFFILYFRL
jgi:hypothetical protein